MEDLLAGYPVVIEQVVDWGDMDSFQHVNNAVYFRYLENARIVYFERLGWLTFQKETGVGVIAATAEARFRRAVTYPDTLRIGVRVTSIGVDRYTMDYRIVSTKQNELTTTGETVIVTYHYGEGKKVPIPEEMRRRIASVEGKNFD